MKTLQPSALPSMGTAWLISMLRTLGLIRLEERENTSKTEKNRMKKRKKRKKQWKKEGKTRGKGKTASK